MSEVPLYRGYFTWMTRTCRATPRSIGNLTLTRPAEIERDAYQYGGNSTWMTRTALGSLSCTSLIRNSPTP